MKAKPQFLFQPHLANDEVSGQFKLCRFEEPTCLWQVKGAMTLPPAPATKVGVPHSSPVFGLEWDRQHSMPSLQLFIRSEAEGPAVRRETHF